MIFDHIATTCKWCHASLVEAPLPRNAWLLSFAAQTFVVFAANAGLLGGKTNPELNKKYSTLVSPAGWAFAIWSLIYVWEVLASVHVFFTETPSSSLREASPFVVCANVSQLLWALLFCRERFAFSSFFLGAIAANLCVAVESMRGAKPLERYVVAFPVAIHAGWTTVAFLLNLNLVAVQRKIDDTIQLACAFASLYGAVLAGLLATTLRGNVLYVLPISWALVAIAAELPANKAMPHLDNLPRQALRLTAFAAAFLLAHLAITALAYGILVEPWDT